MIVVDTNVVVHLLVDREHTRVATRLYRRDPDWRAPPILLSELRHVLIRLIRTGALTRRRADRASERASAVLGAGIHSVPTPVVLDAALDCGLTAYDAEFVVLARALGCPLATLDRAILRGASDVAHLPDALSGPRIPDPEA